MAEQIPKKPKLYHIVHIDRLASIINQNCLWSDADVQQKQLSGTTIGMDTIKKRRLEKPLNSYPDLHVGDCVPFYFCPRSVMLYLFYKNNHPDIIYRGGQDSIIHLQADLHATVAWAQKKGKKWVFTRSNAGSAYFDDFNDLSKLDQINWDAINAKNWQSCQDEKQAEFLLEEQFPWPLVEAIGVYSRTQQQRVSAVLESTTHQPQTTIQPAWYY